MSTVKELTNAIQLLHELDMKLFGEDWTDAAIRERRLEEECPKT